jgi:parallel beta-helix repeat protein
MRRLRGIILAAAIAAPACGGAPPQGSAAQPGALPIASLPDDCPTAAVPVGTAPGDDTPYMWPAHPRCAAGDIGWSEDDQAIVIDGAVLCTLTELASLDPAHAPALVTGAPGTWFARYGLLVRHGAILVLHGGAQGGDVDELRLRSDPGPPLSDFTPADPHVAALLRADWGGLDLDGVRVISWDTTTGSPDLDPTDGRAYVAVRSVFKDGVALESRMDIRRSELAYLGYHSAESYGVVWRIPDGDETGSTLFDVLNVYGDVEDSHFHDNYFGAYTFGAYGMRIRRNEFDHNVIYGLDPHDDSDALIVEDNQFHDNGKHGFICSKRCDHLQVRRNVSKDNAVNGIMLHSQATDWVVEDNEVTGNGGGGIVLFESSRNVIRGNRMAGNKNGILLLSGSSDNVIEGNEDRGSASYSIYAYLEDPPLEGDGHSSRNQVTGNVLAGGMTNPVKLDQADDNVFEGDRVMGFPKGLLVTNAAGNRFVRNCVDDGLGFTSMGSDATPSTFVVDEPAVKASLDDASTLSAQDPDGALFDAGDGRATNVSPAGSTLDVTGPSPSGGAKITRLPVTVRPDGGDATARVVSWSAHEVDLAITASVAGQTFTVAVSSVPAGSRFQVSLGVGDARPHTLVTTGQVDDGVARFDVSADDVSESIFFVKFE